MDLNTLFVAYIVTLKAADTTARDVVTLIAKDLATARSGGSANLDDANTMYADYLTP